jgi:hypothetical protein
MSSSTTINQNRCETFGVVNTIKLKGINGIPIDLDKAPTVLGQPMGTGTPRTRPAPASFTFANLLNVQAANIAVLNTADLFVNDGSASLEMTVMFTPDAANTLSSYSITLPLRTANNFASAQSIKAWTNSVSGTSTAYSKASEPVVIASGKTALLQFYTNNVVEPHWCHIRLRYDVDPAST